MGVSQIRDQTRLPPISLVRTQLKCDVVNILLDDEGGVPDTHNRKNTGKVFNVRAYY
jgi:hypothetical protein